MTVTSIPVSAGDGKQFSLAIPQDLDWEPVPTIPPGVLLPPVQLFGAEPHEHWQILYAHLPAEQQAQITDCRRHLIHRRPESPSDGACETINPESCKYMVCGPCAFARADKIAGEHVQKFAGIERKTNAGMLVVEAVILCQEWALCSGIAGCELERSTGTLCRPIHGCNGCDFARRLRDRAGEIERQRRKQLVGILKRAMPDLIGVVITQPGAPGDPFAPAFTLRVLIPLLAVTHSYGTITGLNGRVRRSRVPATSTVRYMLVPDLAVLHREWQELCAKERATGTLRGHVVRGATEIERVVRDAHVPVGYRAECALRAGIVVGPLAVQDLARRILLRTPTPSGKLRAAQRVVWVGGLSGTEHGPTMQAIDLELEEREPAPPTVVVDQSRAIWATATEVVLQSEWTGEIRPPCPRSRIDPRPLLGRPFRDSAGRLRAPVFVGRSRPLVRDRRPPHRSGYRSYAPLIGFGVLGGAP